MCRWRSQITARFIPKQSEQSLAIHEQDMSARRRELQSEQMTLPKTIWLTAIVLVAGLGGAACNTADPNENPGPVGPTPVPSNFIIDVAEINGPYSFYPSPAAVATGRFIVWHNSDAVTHHVVFDDTSVDTGALAPGTLSQPIVVASGNWSYHCAIHPSMVGSVIVPAPTTSGTSAGSR
jgi:plastocyanin